MASRIDNPFNCSLQVSGDGGRSWVPARAVPKLPPGAEKCFAPEVAFDGKGNLYFLFVGLHTQANTPMGVFLATSSDRTGAFSVPRQVLGPNSFQVRMAIDQTSGPHGRIHIVWLKATSEPGLGSLPAPPNPIMAIHSDDGGRSFSRPLTISDLARQLVLAPALALGPDHAVHVVYYDLQQDAVDYHGLEGPTWDGHWSLVLTSSKNGGRTFDKNRLVDDGIVPPERVPIIFTMTPASVAVDRNGRVFVAWTDGRNGDWDVFLRWSVDRGVSWSGLRRLNDDPGRNGRHQYMPRLSVAPGGRIDAVFLDRRNDPQNIANDLYYTYSTRAGESFAPNVRLTSQSSDSRRGPTYSVIPSAKDKVEFGSRLALVSFKSKAVAAWTDTRNNSVGVQQDIFATQVDLAIGK